MPMPPLMPIWMRPSKKCERCGLWYGKKEPECVHCSGLSDREVIALQEQYEREDKADDRLGKVFLYVAAVLALIVVLTLLSR